MATPTLWPYGLAVSQNGLFYGKQNARNDMEITMNMNAVFADHPEALFAFGPNEGGMSGEVSALLLRAVTCVDENESNALDLIRRASSLLRPQAFRIEHSDVSGGGLAPWQVKRLNTFIERNISQSMLIEELAQLCNLSTSYFSAAFKATYGASPHNHIIDCRVGHAKKLMLESEAPLCEIALDCGLADQAHLSRIFRRKTGTTPSAWRRHAHQMARERAHSVSQYAAHQDGRGNSGRHING